MGNADFNYEAFQHSELKPLEGFRSNYFNTALAAGQIDALRNYVMLGIDTEIYRLLHLTERLDKDSIPSACFVLGRYNFREGRYNKAISYFEAALKRKYDKSYFYLSYMYEYGLGLDKNRNKANYNLGKGLEADDPACIFHRNTRNIQDLDIKDSDANGDETTQNYDLGLLVALNITSAWRIREASQMLVNLIQADPCYPNSKLLQNWAAFLNCKANKIDDSLFRNTFSGSIITINDCSCLFEEDYFW